VVVVAADTRLALLVQEAQVVVEMEAQTNQMGFLEQQTQEVAVVALVVLALPVVLIQVEMVAPVL
jgi:hypothetical protein